MKPEYIPERGDIVWLNFNPAIGHEQRGKRPAVVVSDFKYNISSMMCVVCPITTTIKPYPFVVMIKNTQKTKGVILSDHIKSIDWSKRKLKFVEKIDKGTLKDIQERIELLVL